MATPRVSNARSSLGSRLVLVLHGRAKRKRILLPFPVPSSGTGLLRDYRSARSTRRGGKREEETRIRVRGRFPRRENSIPISGGCSYPRGCCLRVFGERSRGTSPRMCVDGILLRRRPGNMRFADEKCSRRARGEMQVMGSAASRSKRKRRTL